MSVRAWSVDCGRTSLNGFPCVKIANHEGDHRRADGREWPEGQSWQSVADEWLAQRHAELDVFEAFVVNAEAAKNG